MRIGTQIRDFERDWQGWSWIARSNLYDNLNRGSYFVHLMHPDYRPENNYKASHYIGYGSTVEIAWTFAKMLLIKGEAS